MELQTPELKTGKGKKALEVELTEKPAILTLKGKQKRQSLPHILVEVLRAVGPKALTKTNLQYLCRTRKKTFLQILKHLMGLGIVIKIGNGRKSSPFRYQLRPDYYRS
jgi:predicted transcriptional regulator